MSNKIILVDDDKVISEDVKISETLNNYFESIVKKLDITIDPSFLTECNSFLDPVEKAIRKFSGHPSIKAIKNKFGNNLCFSFQEVRLKDVRNEIDSLDPKKACQQSDIPTKLLKSNSDIFSNFITCDINSCIEKGYFPNHLKNAEIAPVFKKGDRCKKENYRPISILSNISKIYEKCIFNQMNRYFEVILSKFQCKFRKGHNTQHCLLLMVEKF